MSNEKFRENKENNGGKQRDREGKKIRRLEDEKIKEQDDWMNRMIPAGLDGRKKIKDRD